LAIGDWRLAIDDWRKIRLRQSGPTVHDVMLLLTLLLRAVVIANNVLRFCLLMAKDQSETLILLSLALIVADEAKTLAF
jgi:hypothetical protein